MAGPFWKNKRWESEPFRRAVASLPCVSCGREQQTQAAHGNQGKGMGLKVSDARLMALCVECHRGVDQGGEMPREERRAWELEMMLRTYQQLVEREILILRPSFRPGGEWSSS